MVPTAFRSWRPSIAATIVGTSWRTAEVSNDRELILSASALDLTLEEVEGVGARIKRHEHDATVWRRKRKNPVDRPASRGTGQGDVFRGDLSRAVYGSRHQDPRKIDRHRRFIWDFPAKNEEATRPPRKISD